MLVMTARSREWSLRLKDKLLDDKLDFVISFIRERTGTSYSYAEAGGSVVKLPLRGNDKEFCSRLVARAFSSVDVKLVNNPNFCTPDHLKKSPLLQTVADCTVVVSQANGAGTGPA